MYLYTYICMQIIYIYDVHLNTYIRNVVHLLLICEREDSDFAKRLNHVDVLMDNVCVPMRNRISKDT